MSMLTEWHRAALEADAYLVISPNDPRPLPIYDDESAISFVRALGYTAIKTRMPAPPRVGACWRPVRAKSERGYLPRHVRSVGPALMSYSHTPDGMPITISLKTWHRWKQLTRAVKA